MDKIIVQFSMSSLHQMWLMKELQRYNFKTNDPYLMKRKSEQSLTI